MYLYFTYWFFGILPISNLYTIAAPIEDLKTVTETVTKIIDNTKEYNDTGMVLETVKVTEKSYLTDIIKLTENLTKTVIVETEDDMKNIAKTVADTEQDSDNITKTSVECYSGDPNKKSFRIKMESGHWKISYEGFGCNKSSEKTTFETEKGTKNSDITKTVVKTVESTEETAIQTEKYTENSKNITKTVKSYKELGYTRDRSIEETTNSFSTAKILPIIIVSLFFITVIVVSITFCYCELRKVRKRGHIVFTINKTVYISFIK